MNEDIVGTAPFAILLAGVWIGWRAARLKEGEVPIPTQGFGRGAPRPFRVAAVGLGGAFSAFLLRLLSVPMNSLALAYLAVAIGALSIGISCGAAIRSPFLAQRKSNR